ncbi:MAG TPA: MlaD family protein [Myxococcota bacterium]|nr:MlaD family protein [Myxococcota bacterium]
MTARGPEERERDDVAEAVVEQRSRPSIVWLIPLVAALVGAFVAYRAISSRGPEITITFKTAEGLEAGKTKVKYKDVEVGLVETVELSKDLSGVICHARMSKGAEGWLRAKTLFWVVKPRISGGQVSGLETLLGGAYIGVDPVLEGEKSREFAGLEVAPLVAMTEAGRYFVLRSLRAGALDVGSPVYFQKIAVGRIVSSDLDPDDDFVTTRVFVQAPYDQRVRADSRFWNASGIDMSVSADGLKVDTQSLISILIGGIAFDVPDDSTAEVAAADAVFPLYENHDAAEKRHYTHTVAYELHFNQSVRGLAIGAPVEFRGIPIGQVTDIKLGYEPTAKNVFRITVTVAIEPERFAGQNVNQKTRRDAVDRMVAGGLRAQLKSGNLLTGQLIVGLDFFKDAAPAKIDWSARVPEMPTVKTPIEEITANLTRVVERLSKLPVEQIGADLQGTLRSLRITLERSEDTGPALKATLEQAQRTLASANALIGPDSGVNSELRRALLELSEAARALALAADQIESQPDSLIWGKKGAQ